MLRPQLRLPDADSTRTPPWTPVWSSHCGRLLCCTVAVLLFWRFTHLAHVAVTPFVARCPVFFFEPSPVLSSLPPLSTRCLSHTQKVVKMQIKLETNWAGRQHTHTVLLFKGCACVHVCVCCCVGRPWGGAFRLSAVCCPLD